MTSPTRRPRIALLAASLAASLTVALGSCATGPPATPGTSAPRSGVAPVYRLAADSASVLFHGWRSGYHLDSAFAVRDERTWALVWRRLQLYAAPDLASSAPAVDFSRAQVLVVAVGDQPSTGFEVLVDSVTATDGGLVAHATSYSPATGCLAGSMITAPAHAVRVASRLERLRFVVRDADAPNCGLFEVLRIPARRGAHR